MLSYHHIPATGNPTCVPPHRNPGHYKQKVEQQIHAKRYHRGELSTQIAPAIFVPMVILSVCRLL